MRIFSGLVLWAALVALPLLVSSALAATVVVEEGQTIAQKIAGQSVSKGDATGNTLLVSGGTLLQQGIGGESLSGGNATGNTVMVTGGVIQGSVMGGLSFEGKATGNNVIIAGGKVLGDVYGGRSTVGDATGNTVTLSGSPVFGPGTMVLGGVGGVGADERTGNTLNLLGFTGALSTVGNFQTYNMVVPAAVRGGGTVVTLTGSGVALAGTTVHVLGVGGTAPLQPGDVITLFSKATGTPQGQSSQAVRQGLSRVYDFGLALDGGALTATVLNGSRPNPDAGAVGKPPLAALGLSNQAVELVAGLGMEQARSAAMAVDEGEAGATNTTGEAPWRWRPFAAVSAGSMRYDAGGGEVRLQGGSLLTGFSHRWDAGPGGLVLGIFGEAGSGQYWSREDSDQSVEGHGLTHYYGLGLLGRFDAETGPWRGFHAEVSARAGSTGTDFRSSDLDLADEGGWQRASFDTSAPYYGAHVGLGYLVPLNAERSTTLDIYGRALWTHVGGSSFSVLGEEVTLEPVNSWRTVAGLRVTHAVGPVSLFAGAGWEQEWDGVARGSARWAEGGQTLPESSLRGATAFGELGLGWRFGAARQWGLDVSAQGFVGKREGVLGRLALSYSF